MSKSDASPSGADRLNWFGSDHGLLWAVALFSAFVNLLILSGPIFMLQVYDRVLTSRSEETLFALFLLVTFLFTILGVVDLARSRIMARYSARSQSRLAPRIFRAMLTRGALVPNDPAVLSAMRDVEAVRRFTAAPSCLAIFDLPWVPVFLIAIFLFHPWLGAVALASGAILIATTALHQFATRRIALSAGISASLTDRMADQFRDNADLVASAGMKSAAISRWSTSAESSQRLRLLATDRSGVFTTFSRTFRLFQQSAMLTVGALLVLHGELSPGAMIASSILMGRVLAPIDLVIAGWGEIQQALDGHRRLRGLCKTVPLQHPQTMLPAPRSMLDVEQLTVVPPGETRAVLRMLSFRLGQGQALGVIGPSSAGKSTLARALTGLWAPAGGSVRLDGAPLAQYGPDTLGRYIGYLPQRITLLDGTIAENISRFERGCDARSAVAAAKKAGAHEMILSLPQGYDTRVGPARDRLSGGQLQRIGLARALFGDPAIVILDEPDSNLDSNGTAALNAAIRQLKSEGKSVLVMAHRPTALQECDQLLVLEAGLRRAFGPRSEVLHDVIGAAARKSQAYQMGEVS